VYSYSIHKQVDSDSNMLSKLGRQCLISRAHIIQNCVYSSSSQSLNDPSKVKFDSISDAYGYKSKSELFRGWFVFKLCSYTSLVNHLSKVNEDINFILFPN
jgi:hypothetical protein